MRKFIGLAVVVALLSFVASAWAVGYQKEGVNTGEITDINVQGNSTFDGSVVTIIANGHKDGVTTYAATESNIQVADLSYGVFKVSTATTKSISIPNGVKGQMVTFIVTTAGGTVTITDDQVAGGIVTKTGWDDLALTEANDSITLLYLNDTYGWIIVGNNAVTVT